MFIGLDRNNIRRYVKVTILSVELDRAMCSVLLALHELTGCDYGDIRLHFKYLKSYLLDFVIANIQ